MILKTVCAFLAMILELFGVYGDGEFKWYYGYVSYTKQDECNVDTLLSNHNQP
jgi:hypothetical protein